MTSTTTATASRAADPSRRSPFAGSDICGEAGLMLPDGAPRAVFDDDRWDFTAVVGLPNHMGPVSRRLDFTAIANPRWRLVAKELVMAMLATRHPAVVELARAYRTPLHLLTASARLNELTRFLNWLTDNGVTSLSDIDDDRCETYLAHRRYLLDDNGHVVGERSPGTRRAAAQIVVDLINHRELFSLDRVRPGLRPWGGANPTSVAEMPCGRGQNKTPPVEATLLQPMLAAAGYLAFTLGPRTVELAQQIRDADRKWSRRLGDHTAISRLPEVEFTRLLADYEQRGEPLPMLPDHTIADRVAAGWSPNDPLTPIALGLLARQAGITQFQLHWIPHLRGPIEATLNIVGAQKPFGRNAVAVDRADGDGTTPWTLPLDRLQTIALVGIVRTAAIELLAAVSGMRSSELMELEVGCRRPPERYGPDLVRYRLASRVVKGQQLGGVPDEWVVIEPAYQAAQLLEQLHDNPEPGAPLLGRFAFDVRHTWFRNWVNGPSGQRLGLAPIPDGPISLRALRRTLAIELAYRPGGVLAAKWHLKHIATATTEGYASRPGGAQAELLAEVNRHEAERNLDLVWTEFRNYQQGIMPAGPGARELTEFFAHIDGKLDTTTGPKTQASDREVLNLLTKRARTLHLAAANFCWFTDPSRALCLKLAGTPHADRPLAGMCDSGRCPQATHHLRHRPVWAEHAEQTKTFLGSLGPTRKTERARLQADHDRALRVLDAIDTATTPKSEE
ncbi:site-specific integrase [Nocardia amamiensis]|uniref:Site-specific integrase n=1 Tax=Nocardia amamiensis TaxID=404578 RepID=A0ABS0D276_9NOCA|nr:site-specific integrase [Nocardia amamiensis]MBF6302940.1 site-specific integrase [Nocardia amamiensis]